MASRIKSVGKRYPWDRWTDGSAWRAKKGRDFKCSASGFRSTLYTHAEKIGATVSATVVDPKTVEFQFEKKPEKR